MQTSIRNILLLTLVLCPCAWASAQEIAFRPVTEADRIERHESVVSSFQNVKNELAGVGLGQRSRFENYFQLNRLRDLLDSDSLDLESLRDVERGMYSIFNGIRVTSLPQLRIALTEYVNFLDAISAVDVETEFQKRLAAMIAGEGG